MRFSESYDGTLSRPNVSASAIGNIKRSEYSEVLEDQDPQEEAQNTHRGSHDDDITRQFRVTAVHLLDHREGVDRRRRGKNPDQSDKVPSPDSQQSGCAEQQRRRDEELDCRDGGQGFDIPPQPVKTEESPQKEKLKRPNASFLLFHA